MKTLVISAFPACGKTYLYEHQSVLKFKYHGEEKSFSFCDSDSSHMHSVRLTYENEQVDLINWIKEYAASHHMPVSEKSVLLDAAQKGYSKEQLKVIMNADLSVDQKTYLIKTSKAKVTIHDIQKMPVRKSRFSKDTNFEI